jgi:hypothetical protein
MRPCCWLLDLRATRSAVVDLCIDTRIHFALPSLLATDRPQLATASLSHPRPSPYQRNGLSTHPKSSPPFSSLPFLPTHHPSCPHHLTDRLLVIRAILPHTTPAQPAGRLRHTPPCGSDTQTPTSLAPPLSQAKLTRRASSTQHGFFS